MLSRISGFRLFQAVRRSAGIVLPWLLVFSPGIFMAEHVRGHAVDVLCFDDWESVPLLKKWHDGTWALADFWSLQIQHRPVIPRMIVIALAFLFEGDNRAPQVFSFLLTAAVAVLFVLLLRKTLGRSRWIKPLAFAGNCLIFSPILFQNFFWSTLFWMSMPVPFAIGMLLVLHGRWSLPARLVSALLMALAATFSFSHGLVLWPVLACYVLLQPELGPLRSRLALAGVTAAAAAAVIAAYFHDFRNMSHHAYELAVGESALGHTVSLAEWENLSRVLRFACGLIGNGLARSAFHSHDLLGRSQLAGGILIAALAACSIACICTASGRRTWSKTLPWLALAAYGTGMALAVAIGRAHLGEHRCTVPRYFAGTMFVTISVMVTAFILLREATAQGRMPAIWNQRARYLGVGAVTALITMQWPLWEYGLHLASVWNNARHQAQGLLMFINHPELMPWSINTLDNSDEFAREQVKTLGELGLLRVKLAETAKVSEFRRVGGKLLPGKANCDTVEKRGDEFVLRGHARFGPERPADLVLITGEDQETIIALGIPRPRPMFRLFNVDYEFTNFLDVPLDDTCLWEARIPAAKLPREMKSLYFLALDSERRRVARFDRKALINR